MGDVMGKGRRGHTIHSGLLLPWGWGGWLLGLGTQLPRRPLLLGGCPLRRGAAEGRQ